MSLRSVPVRIGRRVQRRLGRSQAVATTAAPLACRAPFTSMYLDQHGYVRACCMNDFHLLGNVAERSLSAIWHDEPARELRRAMERQDLTLGCEFCKWQVDDGRPDLAFSRWFEEYPVSASEPDWPMQLELSLSNTCNLQCVMCNGEWSSSIRSGREHRPPLPKVYGDEFFDDLRAFVPHLRRVKILGGEPFLAAETLRVLDILVEMGADVRCHVTTNGTQWTPRVERILDMLPVDVAVSVDAATAATYERIRVGASWDDLQRNLDRFQAHAARRNTDVTVTYCLMRANWQEFGAFCRMADERGIGCAVNTVTQPAYLSLYRMEVDEFRDVLLTLERDGESIAASLGRSRATWDGELERLRGHLVDLERGEPVTGLDGRALNSEIPQPFAHAASSYHVVEPEPVRQVESSFIEESLPADHAVIDVDVEQKVASVLPGPFRVLDPVTTPGIHVAELMGLFSELFGELESLDVVGQHEVKVAVGDDVVVLDDWNLEVVHAHFGSTVLVAVRGPRWDEAGALLGTRLRIASSATVDQTPPT